VSGEVIILTGPPGAGKTTVAKLIAADASVPTVHLMTDFFYRAIRTGYVLPYLPEAQQQNEVVVEAIVAAVAAYARGGYAVVVDGIVGPWFLAPFQRLAAQHSIAVSYVVLRPDVDTIVSRAQSRDSDELKAVDAITDLHGQFGQLRDLETHVIDNSDLSVDETAAEVRRAAASRQYLLR
jgi:cytidylate kinase